MTDWDQSFKWAASLVSSVWGKVARASPLGSSMLHLTCPNISGLHFETDICSIYNILSIYLGESFLAVTKQLYEWFGLSVRPSICHTFLYAHLKNSPIMPWQCLSVHRSFFTRSQFWPSGIVIACVCVSVRVSVCVYQSLACPLDNLSAVQARITKFGWETQNTLVKMPIILGVIDLDLQGQI